MISQFYRPNIGNILARDFWNRLFLEYEMKFLSTRKQFFDRDQFDCPMSARAFDEVEVLFGLSQYDQEGEEWNFPEKKELNKIQMQKQKTSTVTFFFPKTCKQFISELILQYIKAYMAGYLLPSYMYSFHSYSSFISKQNKWISWNKNNRRITKLNNS